MRIVAALLLAAAPATPPPPFAGLYAVDQMEMAGGLELSPDGRFRYAFDYGAVSEESAGTWTVENGRVVLTTEPMPPKAECDRGFAIACFDHLPLMNEDGELILYRWDARIRLQPRPR